MNGFPGSHCGLSGIRASRLPLHDLQHAPLSLLGFALHSFLLREWWESSIRFLPSALISLALAHAGFKVPIFELTGGFIGDSRSTNSLFCLSSSSSWAYLGAAGTVLIWKTAAGNSLVSACTVALMPIAARAPRRIPQGNQRNYISLDSMKARLI